MASAVSKGEFSTTFASTARLAERPAPRSRAIPSKPDAAAGVLLFVSLFLWLLFISVGVLLLDTPVSNCWTLVCLPAGHWCVLLLDTGVSDCWTLVCLTAGHWRVWLLDTGVSDCWTLGRAFFLSFPEIPGGNVKV